ncbi:hypothetical protein CHS0354_020918 [Potamilus streckersoni]|uniref:Glycosyl hydrolase-like 10 domain-containing protein n=1 Tax=Potamilus streckersoni TaxID=2493646 RepID=A0AAE0SVP5_9BIVA|nr:hypothetical protein CHS0354_020918 [Potamilus streckersoni]
MNANMYCKLLSILLLAAVQTQIGTCEDSVWPPREFRGVWVATVANIDWPTSRHHTTDQQKTQLLTILDKAKELHFNAIVFQVRPAGDALYNSSVEPWSEYLTGTQGRAPSPYYDPLQFAVEEGHKRGIEVHTWFNPYRARSANTSTSGLASNHMAKRFPDYAYIYGHDLWMDPSAKVVQDQTYTVIMDVVKRYDIDGVHFDDYFYPYPVSGHDFPDTHSYHEYTAGGGHLSLADWRRENVDTLIHRIYNGIKAIKMNVKFGISPFGIWRPDNPPGIHGFDSYSSLYADSKKWLQEGWVDYLAPQLYWKIDPPQQSFTALLDWWLQQSKQHRHVYAGMFAGNTLLKHWPLTEIGSQITESRARSGRLCLGDIQFSMKYFRDNSVGISDYFKQNLYQNPALCPEMSWLTADLPSVPNPSNLTITGHRLTWNKDNSRVIYLWSIYKKRADVWDMLVLLDKDAVTHNVASNGEYAIRGVDRSNRESDPAVVHITDAGGSLIIG